MHAFVSFNNQIVPSANINLPAISSAALYGKGVFTTLAVYRSRPFLWEQHWSRLSENAAQIDIELSDFSESAVKESLHQIIVKNRIKDARIRLTFFDISSSMIWPTDTGDKTALFIQSADLRIIPTELRLTVSAFPVNSKSPLAGVKSCNYLENLLALEKAAKEGFDEAVRINEHGEITSACLANIFWIKAGTLMTPDLETGCLAGTMRGFVSELASELNLPVITMTGNLAGLFEADEVFLTSSTIGIASVIKIGEREFGHEITKTLQDIFETRYK